MPCRLRGSVEQGILIAEAPLHRQNATGVDVHRHEPALNLGHLPQGPADKITGRVIGQLTHMDDLSGLEIVGEAATYPFDIRARNLDRAFDPFGTQRHGLITDVQDDRGQPGIAEVYVTGDVCRLERGAPCYLIIQNLDRNGLASAAPDAAVTVELFQRPAQGGRGNALHLGVDCGPDVEALRKEGLRSEITGQLSTNLIGEVIARRQAGTERRIMSRLDCQEWLHLRFLHFRACDVTVIEHFAQDVVAALNCPFGLPDGMII